MSQSSINGRVAPLDAAIAEAAELIGKSRLTVVAGLGADVAGARAAIALCEQIGGVVDHMSSTALLRDLDVLRESGMMLTTPGEARTRGDVMLLVGNGLLESGLLEAMPNLRTRALTPPAAEGALRRIFRLGADEADMRALAGAAADSVSKIETISADEASLPGWLAALRARVNGRPVALSGARSREIDALAAALRSAKFGVAVWSAARLDFLTIEMLCGLVWDLNAKTRFTGLPLAPGDNAAGVLQVCGGMTGFPMRTGFGSRVPEHDSWVFDAERLVESGEADCALWISAYGDEAPRWRKPVPLIALTAAAAEFSRPSTVRIAVGRPGVDHDSVDYCAAMGTLVSKAASHPSQTPSVAAVIGRLVVALGDYAGATSC